MICDVGKATEGLENELWRRWSDIRVGDWGWVSFSNSYIASPTSQLILQPFRCFTYVIGTSPKSPGEPPMPLWWCLIHPWWFCNLQWLRPAGLYERCKLALEFKRLKTPELRSRTVVSVEKYKYLRVTVTKTNDIREEIKCRINIWNACYYSLQNILLSRLLSKKFKVNTYKTIIYYQLYLWLWNFVSHLERGVEVKDVQE